jgi:hypothetical protein
LRQAYNGQAQTPFTRPPGIANRSVCATLSFPVDGQPPQGDPNLQGLRGNLPDAQANFLQRYLGSRLPFFIDPGQQVCSNDLVVVG